MAEKQEKEQQELSEVLRVRREKLAALKEAGMKWKAIPYRSPAGLFPSA